MAAKKNPKPPPLTSDQRDAIVDLYLVEGLTYAEIAERIGSTKDQVVREVKRKQTAEAIATGAEDPAFLERKRKREAEQSQSRVTVERLCERVSVTYLRAHLRTAKRLETAAGDESTQLLGKGGVASALGSPAPVIEKARLSVGLTTEKTENATNIDAYAAVLTTALDAVSPETKEDDPSGTATPAPSGVEGVRPAVVVPDHR